MRRLTLEDISRMDRERHDTEARGEVFNEDDWLRKSMRERRMEEILESDEYDEEADPEPEDDREEEFFDEGNEEDSEDWDIDRFADDIEQSLSEEDDLFEETEEDFDEGEGGDGAEDPDPDESYDPWAEDDHRQQHIRRGSESSSSRGLHEAEQSAGNYYDSAHLDSEDGHSISVPRPSILDQDDSEKVFRRPESDGEAHQREMERFGRRYKLNDGIDEPTSIADFEEDIVRQLDDLRTDFYADGVARSHYERKKNDSRYSDSAECERNEQCIDADDRLDWFEQRKKEDPYDSDLRLKHLDSIITGMDDVGYRRSREWNKKEEIREMLEDGEISDLTYDDAIQAIDCFSQRGKTAARYKVISGGVSMYDDVGGIMDRENNMFDDVYAPNEAEMQDARRFIGGLPREVAELCLDYGVELGLLSEDQMNHAMIMAARPTYSTRRQPIARTKKKRKWFGW